MNDLNKLILHVDEFHEEDMKVVLFLLKKMEFTAKDKFNTRDYIKKIEESGVKLPRGYNPTLE